MKLRNAIIQLARVALAATVVTAAHAQSKAAGNIVCWRDAAGKVVGCGDKVPQEYSGNATRVLDKDGNVRKVGESDAEAAKRKAQEKEIAAAKAEEKRRQMEQKRQDDALLNTFSNEKEIDLKRDRELQALNNFGAQQAAALKNANERLADVKKRLEAYEKEKKAPSPAAKEDLARAEREKARIESDIAANEKAKADTSVKYAEYRKRFIELKGGNEPAPAAATTPASVAAKK